MFLGHKAKKLLDVLIEAKKINSNRKEELGALSNEELERKLLLSGEVSAEDIARAYGKVYNIPFIKLSETKISQEAVNAIPEEAAQKHRIIAYELVDGGPIGLGKTLKIATARPAELSSHLRGRIKELEKKRKINIEMAVVTPEDFSIGIRKYHEAPTPPALVNKPPEIKPNFNQPPQSPIVNQEKIVDLKTVVIPYAVISKFPQEVAQKYKMVVFESPHHSLIKVAAANPDDEKVREILRYVQEKNDVKIEVYKTNEADIFAAMNFYQPEAIKEEPTPASPAPGLVKPTPIATAPNQKPAVQAPVAPAPTVAQGPKEIGRENLMASSDENNLDQMLGKNIRSVEELQEIIADNNIPKILAAIVSLAASKKASDVHIEPGKEKVRIRFRVDGILRDIITLPMELHAAIVSRVKILSNLKIDQNRIPQDGRFDCISNGHSIDLRVSTLPTILGEKLALRILDKSAQMYTMEELGIAGRGLKKLIDNIDKPYGIILATGPTGSGKSTTLYAILNRISTASVNIVTLEDPVEYELTGLNQCQIKPKIGFTFANGLRSVLRQDPNVIMVGEIRDGETASLAIHAALTGHLVLSSLHANEAAGVLPRLTNMGIEPFLITSSLNAVVAQRLVRKLCDKCKVPARIPAPVIDDVERELANFHFPKPYHFFEGKGCPACDQGYKGRIGIYEVMTMSEELERMALARKPASDLKIAAIKDGMVTMKQDGLIKALKGQTSINEVLRVVTV